MINALDFKNDLPKYLLELGISSSFVENPAFASSISIIEEAFVDIDNDLLLFKNFFVKKDNNSFSISGKNSKGRDFIFNVYSSKSNEFFCNYFIRGESANSNVFTINSSGGIDIRQERGAISSSDIYTKDVWIFSSLKKLSYNSSGIMTERLYYSNNGNLGVPVNSASFSEIISMASILDRSDSFFHKKEILRRKKLDLADLTILEQNNVVFHGVVPLNSQYTLREMYQANGYTNSTNNYIIEPLSEEDIKFLIDRESNQKVREGLADYAKGRISYYYNSESDPYFICQKIKNVI